MTDFRELSPTMLASPQIQLDDIAEAANAGVTLVINNRPDGEAPEEPQGAEIEAAVRAAGMDYLAIPIGHSGFSEPQVAAMQAALSSTDGKVLGYCRSGTRSTLLWSLAQARAGHNPDEIAAAARNAGYDVSPVRPAMDMLAAQAKG
ncbi:TIGR01244 family phosphatase [Altererythrobacter sp. BO-6]|uniref:TIGR01244 family sulfur transferase n=1 Tax=Altererythrobacter sp. BO-6 TaxID=2604537 RepID=UPI0013E198F4|nr:TIGR01244 family sulfur transferase [Altererythrobacter sp. BO-6]QIG54395.1 TIGR01244 family phosphatase [Altererythrobacter sp. BO-6]